MLSYTTNCIIYDAITRHGTLEEIELLKELRSVTNQTKILEYYTRSIEILKKIKSSDVNIENYWNMHYTEYLSNILGSLKAGNPDEAIDKILIMLDSLESELGV